MRMIIISAAFWTGLSFGPGGESVAMAQPVPAAPSPAPAAPVPAAPSAPVDYYYVPEWQKIYPKSQLFDAAGTPLYPQVTLTPLPGWSPGNGTPAPTPNPTGNAPTRVTINPNAQAPSPTRVTIQPQPQPPQPPHNEPGYDESFTKDDIVNYEFYMFYAD